MKNEIKYFSMFSGVGGFECGLERANDNQSKTPGYDTQEFGTCNTPVPLQRATFSCIGFSEFDKFSSRVLRRRFPDIKNYGDCTKIKPRELPDFDLLCGGFPCQAFSIAGKRKGFDDTRGTLFFEVARILEIKKPEIILLENVKGLLNHDKGETFRVILQTLDELGYEVQWMVLNSKFFGVPQNRERIFIVGSLRGKRRPEILPFRENGKKTNGEIVSTAIDKNYYKGIDNHGQRTHIAIHNIYGGFREGARFSEIIPTIRTAKGGGHLSSVSDGYSIRRLTPVECCRLQGFSDDWNELGTNEKGKVVKMSDTQRYKQMGNAVTVNVIEEIGTRLSASHAI